MAPLSPSPVDLAFERCRLLSRLLDLARQRALGDPTHQRNVELGLVADRMRKEDAVGRIEETFEDLGSLVNHLVLLDMAGAFEKYFRERLNTAIGEARKVVRERYRASLPLYSQRAGLVRDADDFQGLANIDRLVRGQMADELHNRWEAIRRNRNNFAHGVEIREPPAITGEQARDALNEMIQIL